MIRIPEQQALLIHSQVIKKTGGSDGIRDRGLLDSALNAPFQTFSGEDLYPGLCEKAAALCRSIISNHPFVDGNKRAGIHIMLTFLEINGVIPNCTQDELIELGLNVASSKADYNDIYNWLLKHT